MPTFHHFSRKGYSLFAALGKEVRIGVLSAATLATAAPCLAAPSTIVNEGDSTSSSRLLDEATVSAASLAPLATDVAARQVVTLSRDDIAAAGVTTVNDLLKLCAGIDVRQRGPHGVQTDIGISGGTFDQATILLNGVNISSPHTGHLSADLPITAQDIERVEVLEGAAARVYGTQAFTGVINIITRTSTTLPSAEFSASGGQYGLATVEGRTSAYGQTLSAGYSRADGATDHSAFQSTHAFLQGYIPLGSHPTEVSYQLGYSLKPYDANTFYGAASTDQWERNERWMGALRLHTTAGRVQLAPCVSWNRWYDHYQWHKGSPLGANHHRVDTYSLQLPAHLRWVAGTTALGLELRNEGILSTKLGEPLPSSSSSSSPYTHSANRTNISAYLEHNLVLAHWTLSAGVLANLNTALDARWRFYPGVDIAWRPHRHWTLQANYATGLRMPTFTDLYYSGANIEGNSHLRPELSRDVSLHLRWQRQMLRADLSASYAHRTDMIDWVILATDATQTFRSGNFSLEHWGLRLNAAWLPRQRWAQSPLRSLSVQYAWLHEDIDHPQPITASKYAMEYLRHKVVVSADGRLWSHLSLSLSWRWQQRTGQSADAYSLVDARLSWDDETRPLGRKSRPLGWSVYADAKNLLNHHYREYLYVEQPGLWLTGGFRLRF